MSASREKRLRKESKAGGPSLSARKKQQRQDTFRRAVAITVSAVVLFALVILVVSGSGIMQANLTVLTIGDVKISGAEFDFHFFRALFDTYSMYEMYGLLEWLNLDLSRSLHRQGAFGGDESWAEYLEGEATESLEIIVAQSEAAKREGITLTKQDIDNIDKAIANIEEMANQYGIKPDRLLRDNYGRGITLKSYRAFLERGTLSDRYATVTLESYKRSDADLQKYYEENREDYDYIDYHNFTISGVPADQYDREEEYTEEELNAYRETQRRKANDMLSRVTTSDAFLALSREFAGLDSPADDDEEIDGDGQEEDQEGDGEGSEENGDDTDGEDEAEDGTLNEKLSVASVSESLTEFLLDDARRRGDKTVVEDGDNFIVLLFLERYRDEEISKNVRHLLVPYDGYATSEEAEARAEELLQMWKDGAADEDYFAELANEFSTDGGSNANGGLYEGLSSETNFVEEFKDWYLDPDRKPGDTGIVETSHGFHVMYFSGSGDPVWKVNVKDAMNTEQFKEHQTFLTEALNVKRGWFGMLFTKSKSS